MTMNNEAYNEAYATFAPIMRARWTSKSAQASMDASKSDILETMKLHPIASAYVGKLYAELDAIRDAELAQRKGK
jgi:hypothetical protein